MAEYGHVKLSRKAYATDPWWLEPRDFSKWEAWEWFIQEACFAPRSRMVAGELIELDRGEVFASLRFLAMAWRWSVKRVRTWIAVGQQTGKIRAQREAQGGTVYLVVNYDAYQSGDSPEGTARAQQGHSKGTARAQTISNKAVKQRKNSTSGDAFDHAWSLYPRRAGGNPKKAARRAWDARLRSGATAEELTAGVRRYAAYVQAVGSEGTPYVKQGSTFFGPDEHWMEPWDPPTRTDEPAPPTPVVVYD